MKSVAVIIGLLIWAIFFRLGYAEPDFQLHPLEWNAGEVELDKTYQQKIKTQLPPDSQITSLRPSCECLSVRLIENNLIEATLHVNQTLNTRFRIFLYIHLNNQKQPVTRFDVTGKIKGKGFGLTHSEIVIFRTRTFKDYEPIQNKLQEVLKLHQTISLKEYLLKDADSYRLFVQFEKEYQISGHSEVMMFRGDEYFAGPAQITAELTRLLNLVRESVPDSSPKNPLPANQNILPILYFHSTGCGGCFELENKLFPKLREKYGSRIHLQKYDIAVEVNYELLVNLEKKRGIISNEPASVFVGRHYLGGTRNIISGLDGLIEQALKSPADFADVSGEISGKRMPVNFGSEATKEKFRSFNLLVVAGAGLLDGFNPCAFATIVFFVSFLTFAGRNRREILLVGIFYTLAVFITYLLLGIGIFKTLRSLSSYHLISRIILYLTVTMVFCLAGLSLYDLATYLKTKKTGGLMLQLPLSLKQRIHTVIRNNITAGGLVVGVLIIGFFVTLFEAVCTGQMYLPTIVFMFKEPSLRANAILYLILYNLMFIIPLIAIFTFAYLGINSGKLSRFSQNNMVLSKVLTILFFIGLGFALVIT